MVTQTDRINGVLGDLGVKTPCRCATTSNITLSGLQTIDGVALADGDRVLVKNQVDTTQNGIWVASAVAWALAPDFDGVRDVVQGTRILVAQGTTYAGFDYQVSTANPITPGVTALAFVQIGSTAAIGPAGPAGPTGPTGPAGTPFDFTAGNVYSGHNTFNGETTVLAGLVQTDAATLGQVQTGSTISAVAGGTADALTASLSPAPVLTDLMKIHVRAAFANATTSPNLAVNGAAVAAITKLGGQPLVPGDIYGAGHELELTYRASPVRFDLLNPTNPGVTNVLSTEIMHVQEQQPIGTAAGTSIAGIQTRTLNTLVTNTVPGASLAANQITLPAGTYRIDASAPAFASNSHRLFLYNITDAAYTLLGSSEYCNTSYPTQTRGLLFGLFTISGTKVFELRHDIQSAQLTDGLGVASNMVGVEIYTIIRISPG